MKENNFQIVILAAGYGKRMNQKDLPKVLVPFKGKAIIKHLLEAVEESQVCPKPLIVVGQKAEVVKEALGDKYLYAFQEQQLGTGHAVASTQSVIEDLASDVMVLYGDHPLVSADMIKNLHDAHKDSDGVLTMAVVKTSDFNGWHQSFYDYGRIVRDKKGEVKFIIEKKDSTPEQLEIKEVNPGYYCFKADWLWENISKLKNKNAQQEYYLTDLIEIAVSQGHKIKTVEIDPKEALGVNTAEQLDLVSNI